MSALYKIDKFTSYLFQSRLNMSSSLGYSVAGLASQMWKASEGYAGDEHKEYDRQEKLASALSSEVYGRLYSDPPLLEKPAPGTELLKAIHSELDSNDEFANLRERVSGDPDLSALATESMIKSIAGALPKIKKEKELENKQAQQAQQGSRIRGPKANSAGAMARLMRQAVTKASKQSAKASLALEGLEPGLGFKPPIHDHESLDRMHLLEAVMNSEDFKKVVKLAGRLKRLTSPVQKLVEPNGVGTVVGLESGGDLSMVLPSELAAMRPGSKLRLLQLAKWADKRLLQFKQVSKEPKGRGPMIVLLDQSGSMKSGNSGLGQRRTLASAITLACIQEAHKQKRQCTVIGFNRGLTFCYILDAEGAAWKYVANGTTVSTENPTCIGKMSSMVSRIITSVPRGGTDFDPPFRAAIELNGGVFKDKADLVLVTDGHATVDQTLIDHVQEAKDSNGCRVFGLTVGGGVLSQAVTQLCDVAHDFNNTEDVINAL